MASFFRKCIAQKVLSVIEGSGKQYDNFTASLVKVNRKSKQAQLIFPLRKFLKKSSKELDVSYILQTLRNKGLPTAEGIIDIELTGDTENLAFTIDQHVFNRIVLLDICVNIDNYHKYSCLFQDIPQKKVVVEFRSPSIGQSFALNQLRTSIYSEFIANINKFANHEVVKLCHIEDWGLRSSLVVTGCQEFGIQNDDESIKLSEVFKVSLERCKVDSVFQEKVCENFKRMKNGDSELISLWTRLQSSFMKENNKIYERLNIEFNDFYTDSSNSMKIDEIYDEFMQKEFFTINKNDEVIINTPLDHDLENHKVLKSLVESPVYSIARDVAALVTQRKNYNFDTYYYVVDENKKDNSVYLKSILKAMDLNWFNDIHPVVLKRSKLFEDKKRSLSASEILDKTTLHIIKELKMAMNLELDENADKVAEILGITSLILSIANERYQNHDFSWENISQFDGNTGISLQFCCAGLKRLQEESEIKFKFDIDLTPLNEPQVHRLVNHLARFDEIIYKSYTNLEPRFVVQYIFTLKNLTEAAINVLNLDLKESRLTAIKARLLLFYATLKVFNQGLKLFGIKLLKL